jgi:hypothetical protein
MSFEVNTGNGNGNKTPEEVLIAAEKAMQAMQSKFGAVNGMQGELNNFKKELLPAITALKETEDSSVVAIGNLETTTANLKAILDKVDKGLSLSIKSILDRVKEDNSNLKALKEQSETISSRVETVSTTVEERLQSVSTLVEQRLRVHQYWKYSAIAAIALLLVLVIAGVYEINQLNNKFAVLQDQVISQISTLKDENQSDIGEIKELIESKGKKGSKEAKAKNQDKEKDAKAASDPGKR